LIGVFLAAGKAREFNHMSRAERKAQVLKEMSHRFGSDAGQLSEQIHFPAVLTQNPEPDSYFEFNWSMDEWTRGDFAVAWDRVSGRVMASVPLCASRLGACTGRVSIHPPTRTTA